MSTFLFWVVFSTVTAFLSRKIRLWHFIQRSIFRVAFWPVALCRVRMSSQHRPSMCSAIRNTCYLDCQRRPAASPAHLKYLAWLADWPLTSGWAAAFIRCPTLCNCLHQCWLASLKRLEEHSAYFHTSSAALSIVKDSTRDWCHKFTGRDNGPPCIYRFRKKRVYGFLGITSANTIWFSKFFHCHNLLKISNRAIIKYSTSHTQTRRYTNLWTTTSASCVAYN